MSVMKHGVIGGIKPSNRFVRPKTKTKPLPKKPLPLEVSAPNTIDNTVYEVSVVEIAAEELPEELPKELPKEPSEDEAMLEVYGALPSAEISIGDCEPVKEFSNEVMTWGKKKKKKHWQN